MRLTLKQYKTSGVLVNKYNPLHNLLSGASGHKELKDFTTKALSIVPQETVDITCQPSYDGTTNLIINDDRTIPKIINSKFTKLEGNRFKVVERNQKNQTNIYDEEHLDNDTSLFLTSTKFPKVLLYNVNYSGQLKGGNYTFYFKYVDDDFNETPIIAESGQVCVFKGTLSNPKTISGALSNELTDKSITLRLTNLDTAYKRLQVYYVRHTSDTLGVGFDEYKKIIQPFDFKNDTVDIAITGFEELADSSNDEINVTYHTISAVKTQAQVQNMLFFGNVQQTEPQHKDLATLSYYIQAEFLQKKESIGNLSSDYTVAEKDPYDKTEYYNPKNIYYYLGYWPEEMYRFGIVYIMKDGSSSPVYNLRGCSFESNTTNYTYVPYNHYMVAADGLRYEVVPCTINNVTYNILFREGIPCKGNMENSYRTESGEQVTIIGSLDSYRGQLNTEIAAGYNNVLADYQSDTLNYMENAQVTASLSNTYGVFKNRRMNVIMEDGAHPLYYHFSIPSDVIAELKKRDVIGYYIVRQKRLANILGQGLGIGILDNIHTPVLYDGNTNTYVTESFVGADKTLNYSYLSHKRTKEPRYVRNYGLLSLDAMVTPHLQSVYNGEEFTLCKQGTCKIKADERLYKQTSFVYDDTSKTFKSRMIYVDEDVSTRMIDDIPFCTRAGNASSTREFAMWDENTKTDVYRGVYTPFIGTNSKQVEPYGLYNITYSNYSKQFEPEYVKIRGNDQSAFFPVTDRCSLDETQLDVYRGDCFSNTITLRMQRNFTDPTLPTADYILDKDCWKDYYNGYKREGDKSGDTQFDKINRLDLNTVPIGTWITFKCLSNYNLGLRSEDLANTEEMAIMGNSRSFYPLRGTSVKTACKVEDSHILNVGYNTTVGVKRNYVWADVPYTTDVFDNRIMFSNVSATDAFKNGYRVFQGLDYRDIDRQFGAITKLIPWGRDLLCVFEHGVGIVPVNPKALQSTTAGQSIHLYGSDVLSKDVTPISEDFGSMWKDSIIHTPKAVYGVDTYAKKIWRVQQGGGLETISDMSVQKFLNDNLKLTESGCFPVLAIRNVSAHYNNYKGDVMFTFYNVDKQCIWNICYNERKDQWTTRYSWTPLLSSNINNQYYSFDQKRAEIYSIIYNNKHTENGIHTSKQQFALHDGLNYNSEKVALSLEGYDTVTSVQVKINSITSSYLDNDNIEQFISSTSFPYDEYDEETGETKHYDGFDWLLPITLTNTRENALLLNGNRIAT